MQTRALALIASVVSFFTCVDHSAETAEPTTISDRTCLFLGDFFISQQHSLAGAWHQAEPVNVVMQPTEQWEGTVLLYGGVSCDDEQQRFKMLYEVRRGGQKYNVCYAESPKPTDKKVQAVIEEVDKTCRQRTVYMIGPRKAARLAELVRKAKPRLVVECGTALGYSGLWITRELKALGRGKLITIEIDRKRAREAEQNFRKAGLHGFVEVKVGDARKVVKQLKGPVDFLFIDCNFGNYHPCFVGIEDKLADGAVIVADNVGIGVKGMADYLKIVRSRYKSTTEWFDLDLPWATRDAMEITVFRRAKQ